MVDRTRPYAHVGALRAIRTGPARLPVDGEPHPRPFHSARDYIGHEKKPGHEYRRRAGRNMLRASRTTVGCWGVLGRGPSAETIALVEIPCVQQEPLVQVVVLVGPQVTHLHVAQFAVTAAEKTTDPAW